MDPRRCQGCTSGKNRTSGLDEKLHQLIQMAAGVNSTEHLEKGGGRGGGQGEEEEEEEGEEEGGGGGGREGKEEEKVL